MSKSWRSAKWEFDVCLMGTVKQAFEAIVEETLEKQPMRICSYCLMPNHWRFVLWPEHDGDLATFLQRLTITHARQWQEHRGRVGDGHVYQSRHKSFPVQTDEYFFQVLRYVLP